MKWAIVEVEIQRFENFLIERKTWYIKIIKSKQTTSDFNSFIYWVFHEKGTHLGIDR